MQSIFQNRADAGRALAALVSRSVVDTNPLILALPRGGVPVGFEVAHALQAELDIFLVRKLGLPGQEELAIGAIASGGVRILNESLIRELRLSHRLIDRVTAEAEDELQRREELYRRGRAAVAVRDRTVILVDDGLATGATMKAASAALQAQRPRRIIVAVPVAAEEIFEEFRTKATGIVCLYTPKQFTSVGVWYEDFSQTTDEEVERLLDRADAEKHRRAGLHVDYPQQE
jgi:putative phosphoribosyl transferase